MKITSIETNRIIRRFRARCFSGNCVSIIIAISTSLAAMPAEALELGELTTQSRLAWLAGILVAIAIGLMILRRRLGGKSGTSPAKTEHPQHPSGNSQSTLENSSEASEPDCNISDDAPTVNSLTLDADRIMGTSLIDNSESAAPSEVEREVQPDDRDVSVIVDATKIGQSDDVGIRDIKAAEVTNEDENKMRRFDDVKIRDFEAAEVTDEDETILTRTIDDLEEAAAKYALEQEEEAGEKPDGSI